MNDLTNSLIEEAKRLPRHRSFLISLSSEELAALASVDVLHAPVVERLFEQARMDLRRETSKRKSLGDWLFVASRKGVKGVVPNHAPYERRVMVSRGKRGWHLHLVLQTLRTWNGLRTAKFEASLHPSERRRARLQEQHTKGER